MILHCDADAFFASAEQAADKRLRGRPIAVGGERRGIIASASYEARKLGIYTPMPTAKARKLCPNLIVLPCHFDLYERMSRLMFSYAYDFTPIVEQASIDECYLDLHGAKQTRAGEAAAKLQQAIGQSLKLSVSVGVGANKLVSQIASKLRKPHCFIEVEPGHEQGFLWPLENKWLPQVGPHLAAKLNTAGLRHIEHIAKTPVDELFLLVGNGAPTLHDYAMGNDLRPVVCDAPAAKSYGEQETFVQDTTDTAFILARLRAMTDALMSRVRQDGKSIRTITLRLRYNDMDEATRSASLDEPTDLEHDIYPLLQAMLNRAWERRVSVRLVGLRFTKIYEAGFCSVLPLEQSDIKRGRLHTLSLVVDDLRREQRSIMRGHDLWLSQHKHSPRQTLPKTRPVTDAAASVTNRVLRERPGSPQIISHAGRLAFPALNVKSCFSFLDSTLTIPAIIEAAVANDMPAVAITDKNLHAAVPFFQAAAAAGIKPIIGAELCCNKQRLLAYVQNVRGYQNLCRLLSHNNEACIHQALLDTYREGLIIIPADTADVALPEIRYHKPEDRVFFDIVQSMRTLTLLHEKHAEKRRGDFAFHPPGKWCERYSNTALQAVREVVDQCDFAFDFKTLRFPRYTPADGSTPAAMLYQLAHEGLNRRYGGEAKRHVTQLWEELSIIAEVGYEEYFLTVWHLLQECAGQGIGWITRGSAADSLVCYALGISNVCPIRFELYFKRFLNRDRMALQKLPDIDIDFAHDHKDDVVRLLLDRYGPEHAAIVGGFNTFQARSAFGDVAKVLGVAENEIRRLTEHMPWTDARHAADAVAVSRECDLVAWQEEPLRTALLTAGMLDGVPRYAKMHPCGVVLSRDPIRDQTPTFISSKGWPTTHFDMDAVEAVGLIKLDILAQGGLAVLRDTQITLGAQGKALDLQSLEVGLHGGTEEPVRTEPLEPWSDPGVWNMIAKGNARGVHHIESPAMTSLACMADVRDIDRLVAIVSVIRPGAANGLKKAQFARRAQGLEPVDYTHESLAPVLRSTFGVVAYEEHILQICEAFAGLPPGRADVLRRALVKQDRAKINEVKTEFMQAAKKRRRDAYSIAHVWDLVAGFQGYAFCRAHSTAYAVEAYQGAYAKHYHPAEFMAGVLTNGKGFYSSLVYTLECRRLGIGFLSPDVNTPADGFTVECSTALHGTPAVPLGKAIRLPIRVIKDLSEATLTRWRAEVARAPFSTIRDFCERVRPEGAEALNLIRAGAFDSLGGGRTEQFWRCMHCSRDLNTGGDWLFRDAREDDIRACFREEPTMLQMLQDELDLFGYTVSGHPLDLHPQVAWHTYCPIVDLHRYPNQRVTVCGLIIVSRSHLQQDGQPMKFISICDRTGIVECEIFADAYRKFGLNTIRYPVVQVTGEVKPFDNGAGYTLEVLRVEGGRTI
ncbi:DNA polymerase III subunit alpha [Prosthecobacter vanneervenii]|uniref:DNA polymerase IV n=1 Tax=Prosthecobacter vanneervenii TaxID=48466 RepID=A0A7W7Y6K2_9BACT|nr:DNA polymerase III subunit alpha [Prosthecobacter vanneervenii]MBB5030534.1 DNA-directed DNA polymerase III PolC [Prosthecobacter vanneervenii]